MVSSITEINIKRQPITIFSEIASLNRITPKMKLTIGSKVLNMDALDEPIIFMPLWKKVIATTVDINEIKNAAI